MTNEEKKVIAKKVMCELINLGFEYKKFKISVSPYLIFYCDDEHKGTFEILSVSIKYKDGGLYDSFQTSNYSVESQNGILNDTKKACENMKKKSKIAKKQHINKLRKELAHLEEDE